MYPRAVRADSGQRANADSRSTSRAHQHEARSFAAGRDIFYVFHSASSFHSRICGADKFYAALLGELISTLCAALAAVLDGVLELALVESVETRESSAAGRRYHFDELGDAITRIGYHLR